MSITNTTEDVKRMGVAAIFEATPEGIVASEKRGQQQLAASSQLPTKGLASAAAALGIEVVGPSAGDNLFSDVRLPAGWSITPTSHALYSDLLDETGKKRATIGYKAAFYDRWANIYLSE